MPGSPFRSKDRNRVISVVVKRRTPQSEAGLALRERFASNVRQLRRQKGMTQEQLANAAGIDRTFVVRVEKGHFSVSLETVGAFASALDTSPSRLLDLAA